MVTATTAKSTGVQSVMLVDGTTTSDRVAIEWQDPEDADGYTGVMIRVVSNVGGFMATETVPNADSDTLAISGLTAGTEHTLTLSFTTQYSTAGKGSDSDHIIMVTTQSNVVTAVVASNTDATTITLSWTDPEDTTGYSGVMISADPAEGNLDMPETVAEGTDPQQLIVMNLTGDTDYIFTLATQYDDGKNGGSTDIMATTINTIDTDGDGLVDINSLERLDNMRYNLDLGAASDDGRYKESTQTAENAGTLCGHDGATPCTGYELTRSLDFADAGSYEGGVVDTEWRPNNANPDSATNGGWDHIGSCNTDTGDDGSISCGDANDTPFAARFEGNGFTISNLYARNITSNNGSAIGLFGLTAATATIRSLGVQDVALYSGRDDDRVGSIVGQHSGTIVGSYASGSVTASDTSRGVIGGLAGRSSGTIVASYAAVAVISAGTSVNDIQGGLVSFTDVDSNIIASYATGTVDGGGNNSNGIGGLVGVGSSNGQSTTIASYASGAVNDANVAGGLVGSSGASSITASYATGNINEGITGGNPGALRGFGSVNINASYGFGSIPMDTAGTTLGTAGTAKPTVDGTEDTAVITMAEQLTLTNAGAIWNSAAHDTLNAWDFGDSDQDPALRYADYDGTDTDYGCIDANNPTSTATIVIPAVVAAPGGPLEIVCGETLLPGQRL